MMRQGFAQEGVLILHQKTTTKGILGWAVQAHFPTVLLTLTSVQNGDPEILQLNKDDASILPGKVQSVMLKNMFSEG